MNTPSSWTWPAGARWQRRCLIAGVIGACLCVLGMLVDREQFFRSYLLGYFGWLGIALGSLAVWMIHHLTGGEWGLAIRRILEAASRTLPALAILFLPIALGIGWIYPWAGADAPEYAAKDAYLNVPFFLIRTATYFALWLGLAYLLGRFARASEQANDTSAEERAQQVSGPGLAILGVTFTFAVIDWIMSLEPDWSSTIYGALVATGQMLPALALAIIVASWLMDRPALAEVATPGVWNDLGSLLFAFVMLWTYMAFSQYLLIWSGNLPEEITWYLRRTEGGWQWIAIGLGLLYFAMPFLLLLSRGRKRDPERLRQVALLIVAMHFVNQLWMIAPAFSPSHFVLHWMDMAAWVAVGGVWLALFLHHLQARPLIVNRTGLAALEVARHG